MPEITLSHVSPIPAVVCFAAAVVFVFQGVRYGRKVRAERESPASSSTKISWLLLCMAASLVLAAAWIGLLGLEIWYPELPQ
ncbi:MAG TPA: hypothetical protein VGR73_16420 [Bryobacteraceae bacterium]|nr:hypothetical protein [Bryobacteraceae bacterium]